MFLKPVQRFLSDEGGAITVDWVVLTAAVTGMSIAAVTVVETGIHTLASNLEAQLRAQQISDAFVSFRSTHFDALYNAGEVTEEAAEAHFNAANEMTNAAIMTALEAGIQDFHDGNMSNDQKARFVAMASVAVQRNIVQPQDINVITTSNPANTGTTG